MGDRNSSWKASLLQIRRRDIRAYPSRISRICGCAAREPRHARRGLDEEQRGQGALACLCQRVRPPHSYQYPPRLHFFAIVLNYESRVHVHRYEKKITDFNFGSLIRTDAMKEYSEANTIFGALVLSPPGLCGVSGTLLLTGDVPAACGCV